MMSVNIVDAAAVYIDRGSKVLNDDRWILYVPGRPPLAYFRAPPLDVAVAATVPEYEVSQVPAVAVVRIASEAHLLFRPAPHIEPVEPAEVLILQRIKEYILSITVGVARVDEFFDHAGRAVYAPRRPLNLFRKFDLQCFRF